MAAQKLDVKSCGSEDIFRIFTRCGTDLPTMLLDLRPHKDYARLHLATAFCVRVSSNQKVLLDYSKADGWSADCWWGKQVVCYGAAGLKRDNPVVAWLAADAHAKTLSIFKGGFEELQKLYPSLCTTSLKASTAPSYPAQLEPGLLFLGDWGHAEAHDRLRELNIRSVVTIHNNPGNLRLPPRWRHLRIELADVDSADMAPHLEPVYAFIEEARAAGHAVLVHCGAGVSRSATLCIAYLMRRHRWPAHKALAFAKAARSLVSPNDGFWRTLCTLEGQLGITDRSDPDAFRGWHGADAVAEEIMEPKIKVVFVPIEAEVALAGRAAAPAGAERRRRSRSRSRSRERRRRSRSRSRSRERRRRSRSGDRRRPPGAPPPLEALLESTPGAVLEVVREGASLGHLVVELQRPSQHCTFGRLPSCDVVLEHLSVSRQHAQLSTDGAGALTLTDLGSAHHTNLDGVWIRPNVPRPLAKGSVVRFGASSREYRVVKLPAAGAAGGAAAGS